MPLNLLLDTHQHHGGFGRVNTEHGGQLDDRDNAHLNALMMSETDVLLTRALPDL